MKKYAHIYTLFLMVVFNTSCKGQNKTDLSKDNARSETVFTSLGPDSGVRNIKQDKKGNIWIATYTGVFRYDGKSFTNITSKVSSAGFISVLEDRKGNFWFASLGSGVFHYDGVSFRNFTTKDGLANNAVITIYEDKNGNIWFGTEGGASRYDGESFRNFTMKEELPNNNTTTFIRREKMPHNGINSIIEDKTGKFWFSTREDVYVYDGKTFAVFTNKDGKPFTHVHAIIEDKKGNIWLGGQDGLWRYDGRTFVNFTRNMVDYVYEDKKGNIWTSSERASDRVWVLSRYDEKSLSNKKPSVSEIDPKTGKLIYGILEDNDGNIWFGSGGVNLYDGNTITRVKGKDDQK